MDSAQYQEWRPLHHRKAKGEPLTEEELRIYEAGVKVLDSEEKLSYYNPNREQLIKENARLEAENAALWERIKKLNAKA